MSDAPRVLLFDIDGTLVTTGGAGRRAMRRAFGEVCGAAHALDDIKLGGKTDPLILREGLGTIGRELDDEVAEAILAAYLTHLEVELARAERYRVFDGVQELLLRLADTDHAVGLGTGNVQRAAYLKLTPGGIDGHFTFGGFGSDAEDRAELVRAGATRGAARLGVPLAGCAIIVIGDTPRDVRAAHAVGATCVGVTTGGFASDALVDAGADLVVATLADPRVAPFLGLPS